MKLVRTRDGGGGGSVFMEGSYLIYSMKFMIMLAIQKTKKKPHSQTIKKDLNICQNHNLSLLTALVFSIRLSHSAHFLSPPPPLFLYTPRLISFSVVH